VVVRGVEVISGARVLVTVRAGVLLGSGAGVRDGSRRTVAVLCAVDEGLMSPGGTGVAVMVEAGVREAVAAGVKVWVLASVGVSEGRVVAVETAEAVGVEVEVGASPIRVNTLEVLKPVPTKI
jgi:hypothetical protein